MNVEIVEAKISDINKLMSWRMEVLSNVFNKEALYSKELYQANYEYYIKAYKDNSYVGLFAEINGTTVGCGGICLYQELPSPDNPTGDCAYIMNIYVREDYRRKGIGTTIVKELIKKAQHRKIKKIYLETTEKAYPLYRKLGFSPMKGYLKLD